jgi:hypothetical protein
MKANCVLLGFTLFASHSAFAQELAMSENVEVTMSQNNSTSILDSTSQLEYPAHQRC